MFYSSHILSILSIYCSVYLAVGENGTVVTIESTLIKEIA